MSDENNDMDYLEREDISPDSQRNSSGNSKTYYPDLTNSMSELENSHNSERPSNTFINSEKGRIRGVVKGRSITTDGSKTFIREQRHTQPMQEEEFNRSDEEEHWDKQIRSKDAPRYRRRQTSPPVRNESPKFSPQASVVGEAKLPPTDWFWFFIIGGMFIFILVLAFCSGFLTSWTFARSSETSHQPVNCNEFSILRSEFPHQSDKLWVFLKTGVERVANKKPTKPSIFMLVHETDVDITPLLNKIVRSTQKCLGTQTNSPIHLTPTDLKVSEYLNDYGRVISDYKSGLSASGVMVVENFNKIPPYVAQAFHTICDGVTPYVARSVIFLTMSVEQISTGDNPFKIAEKHLTSLWASTLKSNVLNPLLYRVTDVTLHINREM